MTTKENYSQLILSNVIGKKFKIDGFFSLKSEEIKKYENNQENSNKMEISDFFSPIPKNQFLSQNNLLKSSSVKPKDTILTKDLDSTNTKDKNEKKKFIEKLNFSNENKNEQGLLIVLKNPPSTKIDNQNLESSENLEKAIIINTDSNNFSSIKKSTFSKTRKIIINSINSISCREGEFVQNIIENTFLTQKNKAEQINKKNENVESNQIKKIFCNCKKSKCLKLYCECFANEDYCGPHCNCLECWNDKMHENERKEFIDKYKEKNPQAFTPKIEDKVKLAQRQNNIETKPFSESTPKAPKDNLIHSKGCNCRKSNCLKKYCECFQAGIKCGDFCKCDSCKNTFLSKIPFTSQTPTPTSLFFKVNSNCNTDWQTPTTKNNLNKNILSDIDYNDVRKNLMSKTMQTTPGRKRLLNNFNSFHNLINESNGKEEVLGFSLKKKVKLEDPKKEYQKNILKSNYGENINFFNGQNKFKSELEK